MKRVLGLLAMLAEQTGEKVSGARLNFIADKLDGYGEAKAAAALEKLLESARRFPTVQEIKAAMGVAEPSDEDKGREVAERIWHSLCRGWGSSLNARDQEHRDQFVGEIGLEVVRLAGGWQHLSDVVRNDEETQRKAQWREFARTLSARGGLGEAPKFSQLPATAAEEMTLLVKKFSMGGVRDDK